MGLGYTKCIWNIVAHRAGSMQLEWQMTSWKNGCLYFDIHKICLSVICHKHVLISKLISNISHTLVGNKIVEHSDVVLALPVGAAPTTSLFST